MHQWLSRNTDKLAVLGVAIVITGISFGAGSNSCSVAKPLKGQSDTNTQKTGGKTMLTAIEQEGKVHHADEANFAQMVLNSDVPVLVDFYADWCGPCRMVSSVLEELARETTDARIVKVNVDRNPQLATRYGINSIPALKVFEDGRVVDEQVGLASKTRLKKMLGI